MSLDTLIDPALNTGVGESVCLDTKNEKETNSKDETKATEKNKYYNELDPIDTINFNETPFQSESTVETINKEEDDGNQEQGEQEESEPSIQEYPKNN